MARLAKTGGEITDSNDPVARAREKRHALWLDQSKEKANTVVRPLLAFCKGKDTSINYQNGLRLELDMEVAT